MRLRTRRPVFRLVPARLRELRPAVPALLRGRLEALLAQRALEHAALHLLPDLRADDPHGPLPEVARVLGQKQDYGLHVEALLPPSLDLAGVLVVPPGFGGPAHPPPPPPVASCPPTTPSTAARTPRRPASGIDWKSGSSERTSSEPRTPARVFSMYACSASGPRAAPPAGQVLSDSGTTPRHARARARSG